ncbi:uncharacterized protein UV8b_03917 [Ustilaginoidea virens]|uniref:Uncharacterized protein n=2 Tax=Ustilaginoidea virens TaxID=1159556 RepID=A0A8E5HQE0_USTVR|nr:uncharacterized protein UV8b_03917 [Ustilaginoidea virens]QUC19676.1 hypothetical protein UV8b_03917 [Ustilaginoidea virens]
MACLIPLSLSTECQGKRYSLFPSADQEGPRRFNGASSTPQPQNAPRARIQPQPRQQSQPQRLPQQQQKQQEARGDLKSAPRGIAHWKLTLRDIKREYINGHFRRCTTHCHQILENDDKLCKANPVHLLYLHFYAAASLEMQARAIHQSSPHRASLLRQSYVHYSAASDAAKQAEGSTSRVPPRLVTSFSSLHSASESSASGSTVSTRMSSPAPSLGSAEDVFKPHPRTSPCASKKKKVSFCDQLIFEPIIRPDSPTLGFDECLRRSSLEPVYPESILKNAQPTPPAAFLVEDLPLGPEPGEPDDADPFYHARSIHRFCTILSSIRRQITSHMTTLDIEMAACRIPSTLTPISEEMRNLDIKARIERLRACGWNRPRFDAKRYETLRENALADMMQ